MLGLREKLGLRQTELTGLDVGTAAVKLVQLRREEGVYTATAAGLTQIGSGSDAAAEATTAIRKCLRAAGASRSVVSGLCGSDVMIRHFHFPSLPREAVRQAVLFEARQVCPLDVQTSAVEYQILDGSDGQTADGAVRGVMVVATNEAILRRSALLRSASVRSVLMDVDGLALLNLLQYCEPVSNGRGRAVVNVGSNFTTVAILAPDGLPFVRDLPQGSGRIKEEVARMHDLDVAAVAEILAETSPTPRRDEMCEALCAASRELIGNIAETFRYYSLQERGAPVDSVHLCGGFALVPEFAAQVTRKLSESVQVWNPFASIPVDPDAPGRDLMEMCGPSLAVAAGLAMRTMD